MTAGGPETRPVRTLAVETRSAEETVRLGERLGALLRPGDFVGLMGDLGAGKTQLVRGVAAGAGVPSGEVASPTFAIVYPYSGRITLHHADLYRVADLDELYATGFMDLMTGQSALLVEWIDRIAEVLPEDRLVLRLEAPDLEVENLRRIRAEATGARSVELLEQWLVLAAEVAPE